ncbi:MAG: hypothetical protein EAZ85_15620 [Bacteroidetes bacterium]|nr:MAG: hypothetical protein EAZ85_15620 [Bacteroidota bacterium]TAG93585.1 MAG: hypothetical protein EAZ20_01525 [Bacteroidota bacterium]
MSKIKLRILGLSQSQTNTGFALILSESKGVRRLPIIIGVFEAQAIAIEIEKIKPQRPMTHDLFNFFAKALHFKVEEIMISDLKEGVFYAKIVCTTKEGDTIEIDSRPSDAIAIGLRFGVSIYADENILSEAGIIVSDEEMDEHIQQEEETPNTNTNSGGGSSGNESYKNDSIQDLQAKLNDLLEKENYEEAARVRDELNKRN